MHGGVTVGWIKNYVANTMATVRWKDPVDTYSDLPITGNSENDARFVKDTDELYVWSIAAASGNLTDWKLIKSFGTHASSHENSGSDEINIANLSGELADEQKSNWSKLSDKPSSLVADIDDAVTKKHSHSNKATLDLIEESFTTALKNKLDGIEASAVALSTVKADSDINDAISKKHEHSNKTELDLVTDGDHDVRTDNPHTVTKSQVGLSNVDNKSEATIIADVKADADVADAISKKHNHSNKATLDLIEEAFTTALKNKLDGIEASAVALATVKADTDISSVISSKHTQGTDQKLDEGGANEVTAAQVKGAVDASHSHSNKATLDLIEEAFTTALKNKLDGIEAGATADQTGAEIKALYEAEADTNAFTDTLLSKLNGIEASAVSLATVKADSDISDAISKKHTQNTDTDLDATFEATFVKKVDNVNVLSDITSAGADIEDAVTKKHEHSNKVTLDLIEEAFTTALKNKLDGIEASAVALTTVKADADISDAISKKHSQNTDTSLGAQSANLDMNTHKIVNVVDPTSDQEAATKKYVDDNAGGGAASGDLEGTWPNVTIKDNVVDNNCMADDAIHQGELYTATGEVTLSPGAYGSGLYTLPGGTYAFYPQTKHSQSGDRLSVMIVGLEINVSEPEVAFQTVSTSYVTRISLACDGSTAYVQSRYIQSSGKEHWTYLLYNRNNGKVYASWSAPDHPCYGHGGDENEIPHPFDNIKDFHIDKSLVINWKRGEFLPDGWEIILVNNYNLDEIKAKTNRNKGILEVIEKEYEVDELSTPSFEPREIIEIDEWGDRPGEVIKTYKNKTRFGKIKTLKRRIISELPEYIKYRNLRKK
ncbi:MAG: hypothetical protein ACFFAU_01405 [Candidatus Hodarchaeota archaeon]